MYSAILEEKVTAPSSQLIDGAIRIHNSTGAMISIMRLGNRDTQKRGTSEDPRNFSDSSVEV